MLFQSLSQSFYIGINDTFSSSFNKNAFTLFNAWGDTKHTAAQQAVARGQAIFNTQSFQISGVGGLNDMLGQASIQGTCTTCHNTPNVGNHSKSLPLNIGISDPNRMPGLLPVYTLQNNVTKQTVQTTDPGRALITGYWADIGKFKGPVLRGLASRAPYFHNGSAATLMDAVNFYDTRFNIGLSDSQKNDLVAFLRAL